jgi:membrane protease subunit (stomatin/prohibitin family)
LDSRREFTRSKSAICRPTRGPIRLKTFDYDGGDIKKGAIVICYDEDTEVYVNGQKILGVERFISNYQLHSVTEPLKKALKKGTNTIAVHTRQTAGGQYIDLAILVEN